MGLTVQLEMRQGPPVQAFEENLVAALNLGNKTPATAARRAAHRELDQRRTQGPDTPEFGRDRQARA